MISCCSVPCYVVLPNIRQADSMPTNEGMGIVAHGQELSVPMDCVSLWCLVAAAAWLGRAGCMLLPCPCICMVLPAPCALSTVCEF